MTDQPNPRIAGYHAHVYYDPMTTRPVAQRLAETIAGEFAVEIGGMSDKPVGPHPVANLLIIFAPDEFARVVPWLMLKPERTRYVDPPADRRCRTRSRQRRAMARNPTQTAAAHAPTGLCASRLLPSA